MVEAGWVVRRAVYVMGIAVLALGCGAREADDPAGSPSSPGSGVVPCGGELVGMWGNINDHASVPASANVNRCWNLDVSYAGGGYAATTRYSAPEHRATYLTFRADGHYNGAQTLTGPVTLKYAADCLVTAQGTPTCAELQVALNTSGLGEGSYSDTICSDQAGGGCTCTINVHETGGSAGDWSTNAAAKTVTLTRDPAFDPNQVTVGYCVDANGLRFGEGIDTWWRQTAGARFTEIDCADGKQGIGEEGVDCGGQFCSPCGQP